MGRRVPDDNLLLIHPILCFSFIAIGLAASIAIITSLCSANFIRRKHPKQLPTQTQTDPLEISKNLDATSPPSTTIDTHTAQAPPEQLLYTEKPETEHNTETEYKEMKELPLPPAMQIPKGSPPSNNNFKRATSERKASFSLSMKMPRTLSLAKTKNWDHQKDDKDNIKGKLKAEDNVWMKTIILGEKCVPDEEDPVIYEGKGKRIAAYHPKNSSISLSRQCSFLDTNALSISQPQSKE